MAINVHVQNTTVNIASASNSSQTLLSVAFYTQNLNVSSNTSNNTQTVAVTSSIANSNITYATTNVSITTNTSNHTATYTINSVGGLFSQFNVTIPLYNLALIFNSGGGGNSNVVFDFFMSPTGDDNNAGNTTAAPWSISAFNSKQSQYRGKKIGIIGDKGPIRNGVSGGVNTSIWSLIQSTTLDVNGAPTGAVFQIDGGPDGGNVTYIASCTSNGVYSSRLALIDCCNPANNAIPTQAAALFGQTNYLVTPNIANYGNLTFDGVSVTNVTFSVYVLLPPSVVGNVTFKNCEFSNANNVISNNNPGFVQLNNCNTATFQYNKFHDGFTVATDNQGHGGSYKPWGFNGIITFSSNNVVIDHNTLYNIGIPIATKDGRQQANITYNYVDCGSFGSAFNNGVSHCVQSLVTSNGKVSLVHHNIFVGDVYGFGEDGSHNQGSILVYNNTFYANVSQFAAFYGYPDTSPAGNYQFYNNLVYSPISYTTGGSTAGALWIQGNNGITASNCDFNAYGSGMTFAFDFSGNVGLSLATWQSKGYDTHSANLASTPFVTTPANLSINSFSTIGAANTAGQGGAICGALDGSNTVGCGF